jgi:hypothetical protein
MSHMAFPAIAAFPLQRPDVDRSREYPRIMSPTDIDEEIREALAGPEEAGDPPEPARAPVRGHWWRSPDWWLRTTASAAVGRIVGAVLTGIGLVLAWAVARALGVL